jgi:serine/threonine-protein kinase RsbW
MGGIQAPAASPLPLWWSRRFPGEPPQVSKARSWVAELLPACDPLDELLIFASELATNAVTHTRSGEPGGWFDVEVTWSPKAARVVVGDQGSDEVPTSKASSGDGGTDFETGRGLMLIDAMSADWGAVGDASARWLWADAAWRTRGGPLPITPGDNSVAQQFAALSQACPGASAWYDSRSGQWCARLPATEADGALSAPSPTTLLHLLAARHPTAHEHGHADSHYLTTAAITPGVAWSRQSLPWPVIPRSPGMARRDAQHPTG